MADLFDRIAAIGDRPRIPMHQFVASMSLYALNEIPTAAEAFSNFDLIGDELIQAQSLVTTIDGIADLTLRMRHIEQTKSCFYLVSIREDTVYHNENGSLNKTRISASTGIAEI
jgi:hypothetical protein